MNQYQRSLKNVPLLIKGMLVVGLILQVLWHNQLPTPEVQIKSLSPPLSLYLMRVLSLGDTIASAKLLILWLHIFETQSGQFLSYKQLDYIVLQQWLARILQLDSRTQYPLLAASHLYTTVPDSDKQRQMLEFVYQNFFSDPQHRWPWLAHATILAKHRLKDLSLALKYARAISNNVTPDMPTWAREMQIFILEDMGELEQAQLIIGGMLVSGQVTDTKEIEFLDRKLGDLAQKNK